MCYEFYLPLFAIDRTDQKLQISILFKSDEIQFYGKQWTNLLDSSVSEIENSGQKESMNKNAREALKSLATDYPHTSILFKRL